jgi:excisionase family DNA binding protein
MQNIAAGTSRVDDNNHQITSGGINMKKEKLKDMLILTLQHIQRTNELLSLLVTAINNREDKPSLPVGTGIEKHPDLLSVEMTTQYTGYSRSYIYKLVHWNKIPCHKPTGGRLFFKKSELEDFLLRGKKAADYEISNKADEILNSRETKRLQPRRKSQNG